VRLRVVEHRLVSCRCGCGVVTAGSAPVGVTAPVQYGPGVGAVAAYLSAAHHLPVERTARIMADLWGARVSTGWVWKVLGRVADATTGFHDRLLEVLGGAPVVHFDETAVRVVGRNRWVHVACTTTLTSYHLDEKRGHTAIDTAGILPRMRAPQVAVHDGWLPYAKACYTPAVHALCNAHYADVTVMPSERQNALVGAVFCSTTSA
jgi:transposase